MRTSSRKRTHSSDDTNSDDDAPSTPAQVQRYPRSATTTPPLPSTHARKRFRASGLEGTLAKLSLTPPQPPAPRLYPHNIPDIDRSQSSSYGDDLEMAVEDVPQAQHPPSTHSFAAPLPPEGAYESQGEGEMLRNGSVEEYEPVPEIRMHATSWYEPTPDRIIVTDLDGSDADDEREAESEPVVLPSALEMLQKRIGAPVLPRVSGEDEARRLALVPFRPPVFGALPGLGFEDQAPVVRGVVEEEDDDGDVVGGRRGTGEVEVDGGALADEEDGMDVEPMDVEL
ncbi:unnamed protein product [Peniophora sp. CBMAI 1063]|nr:unnamed protein product [Peniophora sp. CBMAI 1063]